MDDLRALLGDLNGQELDYVLARAKNRSNAKALREAGIHQATFYNWPQEVRDRLNDIAQEVKRNTTVKAMLKLQENAEIAAEVIVEQMGKQYKNPWVRQSAAKDVLDRLGVKAAERKEIEVSGEVIVGFDEALKRAYGNKYKDSE